METSSERLRSVTESPSADRTEHELLAQARVGNRRSFGQLIRRNDDAMRRLAYRLLGSQAAMDDALQDAYLKAFRNLHRFEGHSLFSTWLYTVTYRTCLDHLRARDRRREIDLDAMSTADRTPGYFVEDPGDIVASRDALQHALLELPTDQAAVVLLVDGEGHGYDQAAQILGISPGTVGSRLSRARAALRARLSADQEGGGR